MTSKYDMLHFFWLVKITRIGHRCCVRSTGILFNIFQHTNYEGLRRSPSKAFVAKWRTSRTLEELRGYKNHKKKFLFWYFWKKNKAADGRFRDLGKVSVCMSRADGNGIIHQILLIVYRTSRHLEDCDGIWISIS